MNEISTASKHVRLRVVESIVLSQTPWKKNWNKILTFRTTVHRRSGDENEEQEKGIFIGNGVLIKQQNVWAKT